MKDRCEDEIPLKWPARQAAGRPKKTAAPAPPRIPRITRLMALAIKFQEMIDRGEVKDYADLARLGHVTRARITQIMNLLKLAPEDPGRTALHGGRPPDGAHPPAFGCQCRMAVAGSILEGFGRSALLQHPCNHRGDGFFVS